MANKYPTWKNALIILSVIAAVLYALPNLYAPDPAVQISSKDNKPLTTTTTQRIERLLNEESITPKKIEQTEQQLLIRLKSDTDQRKTQSILQASLGTQYTVALNLAPTTPIWLKSIGGNPMKLGLDLRGGVHFLLEVDVEKTLEDRYDSYKEIIKRTLKKEKAGHGLVRNNSEGLIIKFRTEQERNDSLRIFRKEWPELDIEPTLIGEHFSIKAAFNKDKLNEVINFAVTQNIDTLRNRVNELGVAEPIVQRHGKKNIVIQLPGVQDSAQAKKIIGKTATLNFRLVDMAPTPSLDSQMYQTREGTPYPLKKAIILKGDSVNNAQAGYDENNFPAVHITLDDKGAKAFYQHTKANVNRLMAVVFIEQQITRTKQGKLNKKRTEQIINVANIREPLAHRFQITGLDSPEEASELALLLRAGALAAPVAIVEERTVGPSLGQDNINKGKISIIIGFLLVLIFMIAYYKAFGVIANIALCLNLVFITAILSLIPGATLTLPGIAGIVLTVGMAVDANVLIFQRIREELADNLPPQEAITAGYNRAFSTIADANITTLLVALILFAVGSGPVRGFAVTLSVGIITSMFTAIMVSRAIVNARYGQKKLTKLPI